MAKAIIFDWIGTLCDRNLGPYVETPRILETYKARGYRLGLLSKRKKPIQGRKELADYGLDIYFDSIVIDTEKEMPQLRRCLDNLEVLPKDTKVVGDRTLREIRLGNLLGCTTVWICKGEHEAETPTSETGQPTYTINHLRELTDVIF